MKKMLQQPKQRNWVAMDMWTNGLYKPKTETNKKKKENKRDERKLNKSAWY